jgi:hypothetical protein
MIDGNFSIDHIFPITAFVEHGLCSDEYIKIVNCFENLQPMDKRLNSSKGCKYDPVKFIEFLISKNVMPIKNPYNIDVDKIKSLLV